MNPLVPPVRGGALVAGLGAACLDLVVGSRCLLCARPGGLCCPWCRDRLDTLARLDPVGVAAHVGPGGAVAVHATVAYRRPFSALVVSHKEHQALSLTPVLAGLLGHAAHTAVGGGPSGPVVVVPVPSRPGAGRSRGAEPTLALARGAAACLRRLGYSATVVRALRSRSGVADQAGLNAVQRRRNVHGTMRPVERRLSRVRGQVLVVDDVVTTGATLGEACRALMGAGVEVAAAAVVAATAHPRERGHGFSLGESHGTGAVLG